jgi:hypothetical protein
MGIHCFLAISRFTSCWFGLYSKHQYFLAQLGKLSDFNTNVIQLEHHIQKAYLDKHPWEEEVIQSFLPTILVALLALLIPLILLLIAKKAHNITTLSALHDRIMTRYYKFLIVNVLVFFCVGTAAVQSVLQSLNPANTDALNVIQIVADSFPSAGPFYVGWREFRA